MEMEDEENETPYILKFSAYASLDSTEPYVHILKYKATVCEECPVTGEVVKSMGHYDVWRFNVDAYREKDRAHLHDMFDADSDEAERLYAALFDENQRIRPELENDSYDNDILYFQCGRFSKRDRFSALSLAAVERIIDCLGGGCCLAALWPWEKPEAGLDDPPDVVFGYLESQESHEKHWSKIGFNRIAGTSILVRDLGLTGYDVGKILMRQ